MRRAMAMCAAAGLLVWLGVGCATKPHLDPGEGNLLVGVSAPGAPADTRAAVYLDGVEAGTVLVNSPSATFFKTGNGTRMMKVTCDGFTTDERLVNVKASSSTWADVKLKALGK